MGVRGVLRRNLGEWFPHFWDVYKVGVFSGFPSSVFPDFFLSSVILFSVTVLSFWYGGTMSLYWWGFWPFSRFYCGADILFYRFFVFYCVFMVGLLCFCMVCMCADAVIGRCCYCPFVCRVYLWCVFFTLLSFLFLLWNWLCLFYVGAVIYPMLFVGCFLWCVFFIFSVSCLWYWLCSYLYRCICSSVV